MSRTQTAAERRTAPAEAPAPPAASPVVKVPLDRVSPSPLNPRKLFDEAELANLAASIKSVGLIEPVVVRPAPGQSVEAGPDGWRWKRAGAGRPSRWFDSPEEALAAGTYELVAGERRYRACLLAGLATIDAKVMPLDDKAVLEIALIENDQRKDTTPTERAAGYGRLIDEHGYTVATLAERLGKSPTAVRDVLRLRNLPAKAAAALDAGELTPSVAALLARLPTPELRRAGEAAALKRDHWDKELPTFKSVKAWVEREAMVELKGCPFRQDEDGLVPGVPSCALCPKRAGNLAREDPDGWRGVRADVCTDPACYRAKVDAHRARVEREAAGEGLTVLSPAECAKVYPYSTAMAYDSPYLDLAAQDPDDPKGRSYKQLVGAELANAVVLAFDRAGHPHRLVLKAMAATVLKEKVPQNQAARRNGRAPRDRGQQEAEERAKDGKAAALVANEAVAHRFGADLGLAFALVTMPSDFLPRLRGLVRLAAELAWSDACRVVAKRRGLKGPGTAKGPGHREAVEALADTLEKPEELLGLVAELIVARETLSWGGMYSGPGDRHKEAWQALGIDPAALVRRMKNERLAKKKGLKAHDPEEESPQEAHEARGELADRLTDSADAPAKRGRKGVGS